MKHGFLLIPALFAAPLFAADCPDFEAPANVRASWIAKDMVVNSVPMAVLQIDSKQGPQAMLAHYRRVWSAGRGLVTEYPVAGWEAIATARGRCFYTFQTKVSPEGSTGLLTVSQAPDTTVRKAERFPMPTGSHVLNDIQHRDGIKNGRTVFLKNTMSLDSNANYYREALPVQGWKISQERKVPTKHGTGIVFDMTRGRNLAMLTISRSNAESYVLFNYMDTP
ncbi:hypothetical protein [Chitinimonas sp. BJYL2]|uniref:hypothetical protein n=1 Tax=Chitinimonas sp. BJYL2 TaxID=2976696 RepID=UPI0022B5B8A3|nr:hypothetical protein [Chitinimonas sp. BJYL2]